MPLSTLCREHRPRAPSAAKDVMIMVGLARTAPEHVEDIKTGETRNPAAPQAGPFCRTCGRLMAPRRTDAKSG